MRLSVINVLAAILLMMTGLSFSAPSMSMEVAGLHPVMTPAVTSVTKAMVKADEATIVNEGLANHPSSMISTMQTVSDRRSASVYWRHRTMTEHIHSRSCGRFTAVALRPPILRYC